MKRTFKRLLFVSLCLSGVANETFALQNSNDSIPIIDQLKDPQSILAINHLNHSISSLSNIIQYKNRSVLMEEYYSIVNNLTIEQLVGYPEVAQYRKKMLSQLQELIINDTEKQRVQKLTEKKMNRAIYESMSNALSQPWITTNPLSTAVTLVKTTAQSAIDYNIKTEQIKEEEDNQLWEIEKSDLRTLTDLRVEALDISVKLFERFILKENMRITENEADRLCQALQAQDVSERLRMLKELEGTLSMHAPYWYHLGDTYMKIGRAHV